MENVADEPTAPLNEITNLSLRASVCRPSYRKSIERKKLAAKVGLTQHRRVSPVSCMRQESQFEGLAK
jgi:hypothetical protein